MLHNCHEFIFREEDWNVPVVAWTQLVYIQIAKYVLSECYIILESCMRHMHSSLYDQLHIHTGACDVPLTES